MTLSRKIYLIISLLIVIAAGITVVAVLGITRLNTATSTLGIIGNINTNLANIDSYVVRRPEATLRIMTVSDPNKRASVEKEIFRPLEAKMAEELLSYERNSRMTGSAELQRRPALVKNLW